MQHIIENHRLRVTVDTHGAEVVSIVDKNTDRECVWNADPSWWKRCTPVLFPIVGSLWHGAMRVNGQEYHMSQHGFARDSEFDFLGQQGDSIVFSLRSSDQTRTKFPYDFELQIRHTLTDNKLTTAWMVVNPMDETLPFQIGGHPAYRIPDISEEDELSGRIRLTGKGEYQLTEIGSEGCVRHDSVALNTNEIDLRRDTFAKNALIFEIPSPQVIDLYDRHDNHVLTFYSPSPALGLWAPVKDVHAPFVCIEPWWGRTDRVDYTGEFRDKEYVNHVTAHCALSGYWAVEFH